MIDKARNIGLAAQEIGLKEFVLRFWEKEFPQIRPSAIGKNGRRSYYDKDIENVLKIKYFLHEKGYKIEALKTFLAENKGIFKKSLEEIKNLTKINNENTNKNILDENFIKELENFKLKLSDLIEL
ncbi:MAG: MerR family transcriptional regulator [Rickettsiales bacterium]|jgi:DNA-binding transcriptional MerR regulator|nr:MerR family transcriptional regulator [Rickettsiales bacterium]